MHPNKNLCARWVSRTPSTTACPHPGGTYVAVDATTPSLLGLAIWGDLLGRVTIGLNTLRTSICPDSRERASVLPVRKAVRSAEGIEVGDHVEVTVETVE